jgi:hypothetical protein
VTSLLPIWLSERCRCALLTDTCMKAEGRVDFSPTLYSTKVLHNDGFEGWLTCCDLTKWWMSSHWQGGGLKYHLFPPPPPTQPFISPPAILLQFSLFLHFHFHFLNLFPTLNPLVVDLGEEGKLGCDNKWGTKSGSRDQHVDAALLHLKARQMGLNPVLSGWIWRQYVLSIQMMRYLNLCNV